jgi:putative hydrolase of the HAD superfamily
MNYDHEVLAVTFDIGGTLIEPWPSVGQVYAEVAARYCNREFDSNLLQRRFVAAWKARPKLDYTVADWSALVDATFDGLVTPKPSETFFPQLYERFGQPDAWRIYEDVFPALAALAGQGFRLGVISNWDERLRPLLKSLGLADWFETCVVSCEVGASKPSPVPFRVAGEALKLDAVNILHVGDSAEMDLAGARDAGLQAVRIAREAAVRAGDEIGSLRELVGRLPAPGGRR